ncbi:MAG: lipoprotein signal peptidase [Cytophagaceae bacterium]|nr:lipoprotein signal peptidase [Cytophagaceae bacterium]
MLKSPHKYFLLTLLVILIDQGVKMLVYFNMDEGFAGQVKVIGDWFKIHFVTNPGMAFGMQLGSEYGKLLLTGFRLVAMAGIAWYLVRLAHRNAHNGLLWCIAAILGGAIGNVIDSIFYGVWLGLTTDFAPTPWFHGKVIDMFFFDFWEGIIPEWVPLWGGTYYSTPIFNVADASIFVGVCVILIFQGEFFRENQPESDLEFEETPVAEATETNLEPEDSSPENPEETPSESPNRPRSDTHPA